MSGVSQKQIAEGFKCIADDLRGIDQHKDAVKAARLAVASLDGWASRLTPTQPTPKNGDE